MTERTIQVEILTRVEGEGGLLLKLRGSDVERIELRIYEPPRFFEALLRGRPLEDVPDITARICGICPVAYQMSSVHALEQALGVAVSPEVRRLRRLLYCGEWIESHALHVYLLNAPDFLGFDSGLDMASRYPEEVSRGLRMKKHGNQLIEALGGRSIHPINVAVGGFYRSPRRDELERLIPDFRWCVDAAIETVRWTASFDFPDFSRDYQMVSLIHDTEYPMNEGDVGVLEAGPGPDGGRGAERIPVAEYERQFREDHVAHSTALHSVRVGTGRPYLVGPLARVQLNWEHLSPTARELAREFGFDRTCGNPFRTIVARSIELVHAYEEALEILGSYEPARPARNTYAYRAGAGCAATEAPRGLLFHRYTVDEGGRVREARIVPPTSQNQGQIEADLRAWVPHVATADDATLARQCENLVRCYDPCISCSTHFLNVRVERA
ncbi:MAG: Ni/Fe hydrogenase subunit alpha [Planctomycetes bacterium]|nr:Ni/Fe hydrogenase subunit alpha [Planctomycetota bacterium]